MNFDAVRQTNLAPQGPDTATPDPQWLDPDTARWSHSMGRYRHPEGNMLRDGFAPAAMTTADFSVIRYDGLVHLFGVGGYLECFTNWPGQYEYVWHATSTDLVDWTVHGKAMIPHPDNPYEAGKIWPPYVFDAGDRFVMVYCALDEDNCQCLCQAESDDLWTWRRIEDNPIVSGGTAPWILRREDGRTRHLRDPFVRKVDDTWLLYYATVAADGVPSVGLAGSTDARHWTDLGSACRWDGGRWVAESPVVYRWNDTYGLMFLENTCCRLSDDPTHFDDSRVLPVTGPENVRAIEIVDQGQPDRLLVGYFGPLGKRIGFGELVRHDDRIEIIPITRPDQLEPWGLG